jgi:AraC-like DNA-binding protein
MTGAASSSSAWVRGVVHMFASEGVDPAQLFRDAGLDPERLKQPHMRFDSGEINRLWTLAVEQTGKPSLGLDRQVARRFVNFDIVAQAMWPSTTLGGGLQSLSRYLHLINDAAAFDVQLQRGDGWLTLVHGRDGNTARQRIEFGMLSLLLLCQRATRRQLRPLGAEFAFPDPPDFHPWRMAFHCPLRFAQPANRILLARADLELPIVSTTESLFALHERLIEARLDRLGDARTSYRASEEIIRSLHLGEPRRAQVARSLGLAETAFVQKLRTEGHTFESLLDDVRKELASHYLAQAGMAVSRVAGLLGWRAASDLAAACHRWWGVAPTRYRQRLLEAGVGAG